MLGLFRSRLPIDRDEYDWLLAVFAWLVQKVDRDKAYREARTILPTVDFFPPSRIEGHARALELFGQVRAHAGMEGWPCELIAGEAERETRIAPGHALKHAYSPPGGTFGHDGTSFVITYNPSALARPADLVATFAHELSHYLIHADGSMPPGGAELEELATQSEGCVADERTDRLYVGEENVGVWRFDARASGPVAGTKIAAADGKTLTIDVEGVAIAAEGEGNGGYLLVSSQGDHAYAVYRLSDEAFVGRFRLTPGKYGSTEETDGIELVTGDFGPDYPGGLFIAQDGYNPPKAQNFKFAAWADIRAALKLD